MCLGWGHRASRAVTSAYIALFTGGTLGRSILGLRRSGTESSACSESPGMTALEKGRESGGLSLTLVLFP